MNTVRAIAALAAAVLLAVNASGKPQPSYSYTEGHYVRSTSESEGIESTADGFAIGGSFALRNFHAAASYERTSFNVPGFDMLEFDIDATITRVGAGAHAAVFDGGSVYATAGYVSAEFSARAQLFGQSFSVSEKEDGYFIQAGVRAMVHQRIEVSAGISHIDIGGDSEQTFSLSGEYGVAGNVGIRASFEVDEDGTGFRLGVRLHF